MCECKSTCRCIVTDYQSGSPSQVPQPTCFFKSGGDPVQHLGSPTSTLVVYNTVGEPDQSMQDEGCTVGTPHYGATHFVCYRKERLCLRCFPNYLDPHFQGGRLLWSRLSRMAEAGGQRHLCFGWGGFISRESQGNIFTLAAINALIKKTTSSPYSEGYLSKYIQRE